MDTGLELWVSNNHMLMYEPWGWDRGAVVKNLANLFHLQAKPRKCLVRSNISYS